MKDILSELLEVEESNGHAICDCQPQNLIEEQHVQRIPFGESDEGIEVTVPVIRCMNCDASFTDARAEKARHAAICSHQNLLTPEEIQEVRASTGYSRKEFAEAYGIPPASMERWENGRLIQNRSNDLLLRMIGDRNVAQRFDLRVLNSKNNFDDTNVVSMSFGALASKSEKEKEELLRRKGQFKLKRAVG